MLNMILFIVDWLYKEKVYKVVYLVFFCSLIMNIYCVILLFIVVVVGVLVVSNFNEDK